MCLRKIQFDAIFYEERRCVEITQPHGAGGIFFISVDKYHLGQMIKVKDEWRGHFNNKSEITGDDVMVLAETIEANLTGMQQ